MNRIVFESGDQKVVRIGRIFSAVSGLAWAGSLTGATHTFSTPSRGAIHDSHLPSGLIWPAALVGLPKILRARSAARLSAGATLGLRPRTARDTSQQQDDQDGTEHTYLARKLSDVNIAFFYSEHQKIIARSGLEA